jgi:26S proteasome regulatory subunit N7
LKSYHGLHLISTRHFSDAAPLLLESLSTFTSTELCTYTTLVLYAVLSGTISLDRVDFKKKVVDSAEVLAVLGNKQSSVTGTDIDMADVEQTEGYESLETLINSFYTCDYKSFFISLGEAEEKFLTRDRVLAEHKSW